MTTEQARAYDEAAQRDEAVRLGWTRPRNHHRPDDVPKEVRYERRDYGSGRN